MKGLTFINDPWKLRTDQVFTLICMWKQNPLMRRCMDINIVKKIVEYIKVDLSGGFKLDNRTSICFRHIVFRDSSSNYYGWFFFDKGSHYYSACFNCLKPTCLHRVRQLSRYKDVKNISEYRNRFEFDDPIIEK